MAAPVDIASAQDVPGSFSPGQIAADQTYTEGEGARNALLQEMGRNDLPPGARQILEQEYRSAFGGEPPAVPNRGAQISGEMGWRKLSELAAPAVKDEWRPLADVAKATAPAAKDEWQPLYSEAKKPAETGIKTGDFAKSLSAGALSGTGAIAQGGGELLARGINTIGGKLGFDPQARAVNPLQGWINDLLDSRTPAAKKAEADSQITGEILKPSTWNAGNDPSVAGITLQGMNAIGQFFPNLAVALVSAGASIPAQLGIGAVVGGIQALGGSLDQEREAVGKMSHEDLLKGSKLYVELVNRGVPQGEAKQAVAEAAAIGGGLGNAIPSAGEGAFENVLIAALTRGRLRLPSLGAGVAGRVVSGGVAGGALGGTEEVIEQAGQNLGSNIAIGGDRPLGQDTLQNFVMGVIGQGTPGAAFGLMPAGKAAPQGAPAEPPAAGAPPAPAAPPNVTAPTGEPQGPGFAEQFMAKPPRPLSALEQARIDGRELAETGHLPLEVLKNNARYENAVLVAAYGENAAVNKVIEHPELIGGLKAAMLRAADTVERVKKNLSAADESRDITSDIIAAVDEIATLKASGATLEAALQGTKQSYEARQLISFLHENLEHPERLAQFMENYLSQIEAMGGTPSQVRGRAFDILQEKHAARELAHEAEGRDLLEKMEKKRSEDAAYAEREQASAKRDLESKRLKDEDAKRAKTGGSTQRAESIASELRAKARAARPEEKTALSIAMEKANLKGKQNEKPRPGAEASSREAAAGAAAPLPGAPETRHAGEHQPVRAAGAQASAAAVPSHSEGTVGSRSNPVQVERAQHIAAAAERAAELPSPAQIEAGNNRKGHFEFAEGHPLRALGMISIETAKGVPRVHKNGEWQSPPLPAHYGHLQIAEGSDGDKADITVGEDLGANQAYVIDQINPQTKKFDETKSFVGFPSQKTAVAAYLGSFSDDAKPRIGAVTEMPVAQFVQRARSNSLKRPVAYAEPAKAHGNDVALGTDDIPAGLKISLPVLVEETGDTVTVELDARKAFKDANRRVNRLTSLLDCLRAA